MSIKWRLIYADGRALDEGEKGNSIIDRWPNPVELHLVGADGRAFLRIPLERGEVPIFYRQRSAAAPTGAAYMLGGGAPACPVRLQPRLDATVFGAARDSGSRVHTRLWAYVDGRVIDCPPRHIAQGAINLQLGG